jgi:hypothetical protein
MWRLPKFENEEKLVQDQVHNKVGRHEGRIEMVMEWHEHEAVGKDKVEQRLTRRVLLDCFGVEAHETSRGSSL